MQMMCWVILLGVILYGIVERIIKLEAKKREIDRLHEWLAYEIEAVVDDAFTSDEAIDELFSVAQFADRYFEEVGAGARLPSLVKRLEQELEYAEEEYL